MKKVFFICISVGLLATSCNWFKSEPKEKINVENNSKDTLTVATTDSLQVVQHDTSVAVAEVTKEKTKKGVRK